MEITKKDWNSIDKFTSLATARVAVENSVKIKMIVLGDDGKYWVAKPKVTEKLVKLGYEYTK